MIEVVGVRFKQGTRTYYFDPNHIFYKRHTEVIVETKNGLEVGIVNSANQKVDEADIVLPLKKVIRKMTRADQQQLQQNNETAEQTQAIFLEKVKEEALDIQLVNVSYNFDATHVVFSYTADGRIDFRNLVKKLAYTLRVRIEMRQINMREKARMIGGIGPCGYDLCCSTFLHDLHGATIKMVKNQRLTLVPERISGLCGKLLCCLRYENDIYTELAETLPDVNQIIQTPDGEGKVVYLNVLSQQVDVLFVNEQGIYTKKRYAYEELKPMLEKTLLSKPKPVAKQEVKEPEPEKVKPQNKRKQPKQASQNKRKAKPNEKQPPQALKKQQKSATNNKKQAPKKAKETPTEKAAQNKKRKPQNRRWRNNKPKKKVEKA